MGNQRREPIRVLLSEGSSLSARQTITALGGRGYVLDVLDPNSLCVGRFSRFVHRLYRCPVSGADPLGYLAFVQDRLAAERYDVLLPVHEQAFLFAKVREQLPPEVGVALAGFDAFQQMQGKAAFVRLMERLSLPQPATRIVSSRAELDSLDGFPCYVKSDYSTAGQGVWRVEDVSGRDRVVAALERLGLLDGQHEIVVQDVAPGALCQAQAVFVHGRPVGIHCTQTRGVSAGGGHSARVGVDHPDVREHVTELGTQLGWHGPFALDYLWDEGAGRPAYIEANPRLVEPMNAVLSGVNLAELTVRVALEEELGTNGPLVGRPGVRSHSLLAVMAGIAAQGGTRRDILRTIAQAVGRRGIYAGSREDLTPVRNDPRSIVPLGIVAARLLLRPDAAVRMAAGAVAAYSLGTEAIESIQRLDPTTLAPAHGRGSSSPPPL